MSIRAFWYGDEASPQVSLRNWGDILAPYIIRAFSGQEAVSTPRRGHRHFVVGSILHRLHAGDQVWGCGVISPKHAVLPPNVVFHAVRGPHTRRILRQKGARVPEIYGDPALLIPHLYRVRRPTVTHRLGILPHYVDMKAVAHLASPEVKVIDISAGIEEVIREVSSCERIVSSSLHGVILGDCYAQKTAWLTVKGGAGLVGKAFKFNDYLASTGRGSTPSPLEQWPKITWLSRMEYDSQPLIDACPFNLRGIKCSEDLPLRWLQ